VSANPSGSDGKLISAAEVARLAGVTRAAVSNWRRRHADFPEPAGGGRNSLFALSEVTEWLDRQRKNSDVSDEVLIWQDIRALHGDDMIGGVADVAEMFTNASTGRLDERTRLRLDGWAEQASPAEVVSALSDRVIASGGTHTTTHLAAVVAQFAGNVTGTVFDPACGAGSLLLPFGAGTATRLIGQDVNASAARLARARGTLAGVDLEVEVGDSLKADAWPDLRAALVVCDPPTGLTDWGRDALLIDKRWEFGIPTKAEGELAWLQHCYAHIAPGGKAIIVMPPSAAYRRAGRRIRAELLRNGILDKVVALPPGMVASHSQPVHLWILQRATEARQLVHSVGMVDLSGADPSQALEMSALPAVDVPVIDLLDETVDLTPAAHASAAHGSQAEEYVAAKERVVDQLRQVADLLPVLSPGPGAIDGGTLRVADLARAGLVDIGEGTAISTSDQLDTNYLRGFLRSAANASRNTSSSGTFRADIRGARIPQMGIEEQRSYGAAFHALDDAESRLRELGRLGLEAIARAREGLTSGALRPDPRQ
jgi:predicted RNA methylase/predicted DNA-binding transcriptional regulator AlpA